MSDTAKASDCAPQRAKTNRELAQQIALIVRRAGLDYERYREVSRQVRKLCDLRPAKKGKRLPSIPDQAGFRRLFELIDRDAPILHGLLLRFFFFSGLRVAELCRLEVKDIDLEAGRVRVNAGKGDKDRVTLLPRSFLPALRCHVEAHPGWRWLFQSERHGAFSVRRVQQIVKRYATAAGVACTPHTLRHCFVTWLVRHSGMSQAEVMLLTGHQKPETLQVYTHLVVDTQVEERYQAAFRKADL